MSVLNVISNFARVNASDIGNGSVGNALVETPITNDHWKFFVFLIILSTLFLILAVSIYILLWDKQNLHGWTQFSYLLSFLLFNIVFIPALCPGLVRGSEVNNECYLLAVANQLFFICSKTWLLIIGFDILWNLWNFESTLDGNNNNVNKLIGYSLIGWILPMLFVGLGVTLNLQNQDTLRNKRYDDGLWTHIPDYGHLHCRIPNWSVWEVFVFSNCVSHLFMFGLIMFLILKHRYSARYAIQSSTNSRNQRQSIILFIKLFFVVGLSWSYIALQDLLKAGNINTSQNWGWNIFRVMFFLQGVFISLIYICNLKTIRLLEKKYPRFGKFIEGFKEKMMDHCCSQLRRESSSSLSTKSKVWALSPIQIDTDKDNRKPSII